MKITHAYSNLLEHKPSTGKKWEQVVESNTCKQVYFLSFFSPLGLYDAEFLTLEQRN